MNRYKRISELGWSRQLLENAVFLVAGAGALGNEVVKNLALLGAGTVLLADPDTIEDHNLTRSVLFREDDIGRCKAEIAAHRASQLDPNIKVMPFNQSLQNAFGLGVFKRVNVVLGCLDNIQARIDLNRACYKTGAFFIDAGLRLLDGDLKVFGKPYEVCLDCTINQQLRDEAWRRFSCLKLRHDGAEAETLPTAPTISAIMAGLQVQLAIKYLHGNKVPLGKRLSVFGGMDDFNVSGMPRNEQCPTHLAYDPLPDGGEIVSLPHKSSALTMGQLLQIVGKDLGEGATVELDYDLITELVCHEHEHYSHPLKKRGSLYVDEALCPHCKKDGKTPTQALMSERFLNCFDGREGEGLLNKSLRQLGVPPLHILTAKNITPSGEPVYKHYELTGDEAMVFG